MRGSDRGSFTLHMIIWSGTGASSWFSNESQGNILGTNQHIGKSTSPNSKHHQRTRGVTMEALWTQKSVMPWRARGDNFSTSAFLGGNWSKKSTWENKTLSNVIFESALICPPPNIYHKKNSKQKTFYCIWNPTFITKLCSLWHTFPPH